MSDLNRPAWLIRALQRWHVYRSRLGRLLKRRNVAIAQYVRAFPIVEVETQLAACFSCHSKALCDRALRSRVPSRSRYTFCPNTRFIERYELNRIGVWKMPL